MFRVGKFIGECARASVTSLPVKSAHCRGSVESSSQLCYQSLEPVRVRTTGGHLPGRYEPAICSGALVPHKSGLWIGKPGFATYTTMYNVFYVIHHSMIMNTKKMIANVKINGLEMQCSVGLLVYRIQYSTI